MKLTTCPTPGMLQDMLLGKCTEVELEAISNHLQDCQHCSSLAESGFSDDDLLASMRLAGPVDVDDEVLLDAIVRSYELKSEAETNQHSETLATSDTKQSSDFDEQQPPLDFLGPAQQADELGRLGSYRVLEVMGAGGMGLVFRAEDLDLQRQVALKVMMPRISSRATSKERFLREARAAAAIDHDNVVQIFQVGEDAGVPFIAMQYLHGESLQTRQKREGKLPQTAVVRIGREVAEGLAAAHDKRLIHRDIKPDNIWLEAGRDRAKILDFGLARSHEEDAGLTQTGVVVGTPKYMAPEQVNGETADERSDLFSLGSVLYHLATGQEPFRGKNLTSILIAVSQANFPKIESVASDLHPALSGLISRLLARDPEDRPQSAEEVAQTLADIESQLNDSLLKQNVVEPQRAVSPVSEVQFPESAGSATPVRHQADGKGGGRNRIIAIVAAGMLGLLGLFAAPTIFKLNVGDGTLVLKVTGDDFETAVRGKRVKIRNTQTDAEYTIDLSQPESQKKLKPGPYQFVLMDSEGLRTKTDRFTIASGDEQIVEVYWEPTQNPTVDLAPEPAETHAADTNAAKSSDRPSVPTASPVEPAKPVDGSDRAVAEYVLQQGGVVVIGRREFRAVDELPAEGGWHLSVVYLSAKADDEDLKLFAKLPKLERLHVQYSDVSGSGFEFLRDSSIQSLTFHSSAVHRDAYRYISEIESLTHIALQHKRPEHHTVSLLMEMPNLEHLDLYGMPTPLSELKDLPKLPSLTDLNLRFTGLQDEIIPILTKCKKLRAVALGSATEAGLLPLYECEQLRFLNIGKADLSDYALQKLREALPQCDININGIQHKPRNEETVSGTD